MELEEIISNFKTPQVKVRRRTSFFNLEESSEADNCRTRTEYIEKLTSESQDWVALIQKTNARVRELAKTDKPVYDSSILSTERRDFLNQAIDIKAYMEGYENLTKHVLYYVKKKEWMQKRVQYAQQLVDDAILDQTIELLSTNR